MSIIVDNPIQNNLSVNMPISFTSKDSHKLSEIHKKNINISILERILDNKIIYGAKQILNENLELNLSEVVKFENVLGMLKERLGHSSSTSYLLKDISNLVKMFCEFFDEEKAWVRIDAIDKPMCPRFHTDFVKCRMVTTYIWPGTQWLPHKLVDRSKLGHGNQSQMINKDYSKKPFN